MGPYDNEQGIYIASQDWEDGQWLMDAQGALHIVPVGGDGVEGPDCPSSDAILAALREAGADELDEHTAAAMGLIIVSPVLKRFDPISGYYSA